MTSSLDRSRLIIGSLLILTALALGAGTADREPARPDSVEDVPARPVFAVPVQPASEAAKPASDPAESAPTASAALLVIEGGASWYSDALAGRPMASGVPYDPDDLIAAHRALPFGTRVRVTNLANGREVEVLVMDRGPFIAGRDIDLSRRAAEQIGMIRAGHGRVRIAVLEYGS